MKHSDNIGISPVNEIKAEETTKPELVKETPSPEPARQIVIDFAQLDHPHVSLVNVSPMMIWSAVGILEFYANKLHAQQEMAEAFRQQEIAQVAAELQRGNGRDRSRRS